MQDKPDNPVLIVGCGDIGRRVAVRLLRQNRMVTGVVRSEAGALAARVTGAHVLRVDLDSDTPPPGWASGYAEVYYFAPPPREGDTDERLRRCLAQFDSGKLPLRIVYISTSAVYGDCSGDWITEAQPVAPTTARGRRRLDAETRLREWTQARGVRLVILRVPGIYGPGRLGTQGLRDAMPVLREEDANPGNRIHVDDLASCCIAALSPDVPDGIYNVGDGDHCSGICVTGEVARQADLPPPPAISLAEAQQTFSPMRLSFLRESRVVDTTKMRRVLGVTPKYADAADGIAASLEEEANL